MPATNGSGNDVLSATLRRLYALYRENRKHPGTLLRIGIKPRWNAVIGSRDECGIATNSIDINTFYGRSGEPAIRALRTLIGKPLFTLAEEGILSDDPLERSIGIACMSALSQKFLGCNGIRRRGYLSQCWKTGDEFVQDFPVFSRVITPDQTVAVVGYGRQIAPVHAWCRKLHIIQVNPLETLESVLIDDECNDLPSAIEYHTPDESERVLGAADVVLMSTSTLVDNTFEQHIRSAKNARLIGMYGIGSSLIPDAFFERGVDMFSSFRIINPLSFNNAMENDYDMEHSMNITQKQYLMMRPDADFGCSPLEVILRHTAAPGGH